MNVERWTPEGRIDRTCNLRADQADAEYNRLSYMAREPFCKYYRILIRADGRIVRDTEHEVFGRSTVVPGMVVSFGKSGMAEYMHSDGFATTFGYGNQGE